MTSSSDLHKERMRELAFGALADYEDPGEILSLLSAASEETGYCVCCTYKKKGATGTGGSGKELTPIDHLDLVIRNHQRDGDLGILAVRMNHAHKVLRALWRAPVGSDGFAAYTDEQLFRAAKIKSTDSSKGMRAALVKGNWVRPVHAWIPDLEDPEFEVLKVAKRDSQHGAPMALWELTPWGRLHLDQLVEEQG